MANKTGDDLISKMDMEKINEMNKCVIGEGISLKNLTLAALIALEYKENGGKSSAFFKEELIYEK